MLNQVTLIGRLGADPEIRNIDERRQVASLRVATWKSWWNKDKPNPETGQPGTWETDTQWHSVVAWGDQCTRIAKMRKGDSVLVEGALQYRQWETEDGQKRYTTEIVGQVRATPPAHATSRATDDGANPPAGQPRPPMPDAPDDLPF